MDIDQTKIQEMMTHGLQYGHSKKRNNPKANPYIISTKNNIKIINLEITYFKLKEAIEAMADVLAKKGTILFVSSFPSTRKPIKELAELLNQPYTANKWVGGLITNFKTILGRIKYYVELKEKFEKNEFSKYTKKEQAVKQKELEKLDFNFKGLVNLKKKPDMVFILDTGYNNIAMAEAKIAGAKIVGVFDNDDNPEIIDYPIPANDSSFSSVSYLTKEIGKSIQEKLAQKSEIIK
ncbi:MAG: 30S ribosomal protein S2 [Candidatus Pacebacteria bacterium]|nr:30S ribosomal protein S2 [Candidatus Paceibacterota bacterium]